MKVIAIGRNYSAHAKELNNAIPTQPVIFLKPDTAVLKQNRPFYYPEFSKEIHFEAELVLKIAKEGKYIAEKFAHKYYDEIGLGIDFTARDLQNELKGKGLPWEIAKGFDNSAAISEFIPLSAINDQSQIEFGLKINEEWRQNGNTRNMLFSFDQIISYASQFFTLKKGDLIFTGTPEGVGEVHIGDRLKGYIGNSELLNFEIK